MASKINLKHTAGKERDEKEMIATQKKAKTSKKKKKRRRKRRHLDHRPSLHSYHREKGDEGQEEGLVGAGPGQCGEVRDDGGSEVQTKHDHCHTELRGNLEVDVLKMLTCCY